MQLVALIHSLKRWQVSPCNTVTNKFSNLHFLDTETEVLTHTAIE